jgi:hypothetical protein
VTAPSLTTPDGRIIITAPAHSTMSKLTYCEAFKPSELAPGPNTTPLEPYIRRAEQLHFSDHASDGPFFAGLTILPVRCRDTFNRIVIFGGCSDLPHYGHLELLVHVFLRSDICTVAAMLYPGDAYPCSKPSAIVKGKRFLLSKEDRRSLWQGELLSRMA